ncbi:hypothetical protein HDU79_000472 [Rhizoclosmatium sp. JEL0117]|nr:hypothetical protein HDU79_000472 [Rhizoclosmatium sp. JEL0117]
MRFSVTAALAVLVSYAAITVGAEEAPSDEGLLTPEDILHQSGNVPVSNDALVPNLAKRQNPLNAMNSKPTNDQPGTFAQLVSKDEFTSAMKTCGMYMDDKPTLYDNFVSGFDKTVFTGGRKEIALLLGNTAHESASYTATEEFRCKGVTVVTADCPYGWYHGRGFIQLSWDFNYRPCGIAIGHDLISDPDLILRDPVVNMQTVKWYWTSTSQPMLRDKGYTLGNSVMSINGPVECPSFGKQIAPQRVQFIRCFQNQLAGISADDPAAADWC